MTAKDAQSFLSFQDLILRLQQYWAERGCVVMQPYDKEMGAGTFHPATFLRAVGPEPWSAAYVQPSRRPTDGRYGDNPFRLQHYYQYQVVIKPSPDDFQDLYLKSLQAIGIDTRVHDIRFVEDNWESPTLGAWGLGWEVWLNGMEVTQFTYFQQVGGLECRPVTGEITYGLERLAMYLQNVESIFDIVWTDGPLGRITYGDVYHQNEVEQSRYNFDEADVDTLFHDFDHAEHDCERLIEKNLALPAYETNARGIAPVQPARRPPGNFGERTPALHPARAGHGPRRCGNLLQQPRGAGLPDGGIRASPEQARMKPADLLVEIGTEELPPKALRGLMDAFAANLESGIDEARLEHGALHAYASPRRLAVLVEALAAGQEDRRVSQKGPPVSVAFDDDGNPLPPATAFAKKCGVDVAELGRIETDKGAWLVAESVEKGRPAAELLPGLIEKALADLPIPRRMRWGDGDAEFVRPVHWIVLLHGTDVVEGSVMGLPCGNTTMGHRFHSDGPVTIARPADYVETLEKDGHVIADFDVRRKLVHDGVEAMANKAHGNVVDGESLFDEVAALVEWPVPVLGNFDEAFLELPREVVVSTLTGHQRYFPIADDDGVLLPCFVTVANLESREPDKVRDGNERVIRPRLADAAFFWNNDRRKALSTRREALHDVVYQRGLGSLFDKSSRTAELAAWIAASLDMESAAVERAAELCKCDLLTGMVGEFPDLQGTMGRYYALSDGESDAVATAIGEHYQPRFAGDALPATDEGRVLAIADKLDTLAGIFTHRQEALRQPRPVRAAALGPWHHSFVDRVRARSRPQGAHRQGARAAARRQGRTRGAAGVPVHVHNRSPETLFPRQRPRAGYRDFRCRHGAAARVAGRLRAPAAGGAGVPGAGRGAKPGVRQQAHRQYPAPGRGYRDRRGQRKAPRGGGRTGAL